MNVTTEFCLLKLVSLGTKFQVQLTTLIFLTKLAQKRNFQLKTEKSHLCVHPWSLLTRLNFSARGPADTGILMSLLLLVAETVNFTLNVTLRHQNVTPAVSFSMIFFKSIHYTLLNNFIRMIDMAVFVNHLFLFDFKVLASSFM